MIHKIENDDWIHISQIYAQGLQRGIATFETACPTYEEWGRKHLPNCRFVAIENGNVVGGLH